MPSSDVLRYRAAQLRPANNSQGTSSASSSSALSPPPEFAGPSTHKGRVHQIPITRGASAPAGRIAGGSSGATSGTRGQLKKLYQQRNPNHDVNGYLTTRKLEQKTIKNREKRVRKQYVLGDGRVIEEGDPEVLIDRVEDVLTREEEHELDGEPVDEHDRQLQRFRLAEAARYADLAAPGDVVDDTFTRTINTHDVKEDVTTTAASRNLGRISRRAIDKALREKQPISEVIERHRNKKRRDGREGSRHYEVQQAPSKPKVIYSTKSHRKTIDTEDVHNISRKMDDGKVYTETIRTQQHEIIDDKQAPDDEAKTSGSEAEKVIKDRQKYRHTKRDEFTDFYRVPKRREIAAGGDQKQQQQQQQTRLVARGPHITTEEREIEKGEYDWDDLEERILRNREKLRQKLRGEAADRADALTKKPLNYHHEEKTRKKETNKWLEKHFGSDWSVLNSSSNSNNGFATTTGHTGRVLRHHFSGPGNGQVRRSISFSSIPITYVNPRDRQQQQQQPQQVQVTTNHHEMGTEEEEEETKTIETRKVVKTKTTTYSPGGTKTVHSSVQHIEEPTQRFHSQTRTVHPPRNQRPYNSTLSLSTPKAEFALQTEYQGGHGHATMGHRSRRSQHNAPANDPYCSTQSLNRRHQHRPNSYYFGEGDHVQHHFDVDEQFRQEQMQREEESVRRQHHNHHHHRHHRHVHEQEHQRASSSGATLQRPRRCREHRLQQDAQHVDSSGHFNQSRQHIYEERYSANRSESSPPTAKAKASRLVPTLDASTNTVVYRPESASKRAAAETETTTTTMTKRQPIYITEFTKEKLYPAKSENNLLYSGSGGGGFFTERHENSGYFQQQDHRSRHHQHHHHQEEYDLRPQDYLGFRSMERHDGIGDSYNRSRRRSVDSAAENSSSDGSRKKRGSQNKRSHSFVDARPRHHMFQDDFVYDRDERKFVSLNAMRHGHSNLRLDARETSAATLPSKFRGGGGKTFHAEIFPGDGGAPRLKQWHSREIVHQQEEVEPQKFKTIIFLTGS